MFTQSRNPNNKETPVHTFSPLYKADRCFDRIPIHFRDTLMYVDPITRPTYDYATPIACEIISKNIIELDLDSEDQDFYIPGPEPIKQKPPLMFTPSQIKTTLRPKTCTAQVAGIYSNAELDQFWNKIFFLNTPIPNFILILWERLLVTPLFLLIHLTTMRILLITYWLT